MMTTQQQSGRWPFDKANAEVLDNKLVLLERFVGDTVSAMAESTSLPPEEALSILENIHVEMMGEIREAVQSFGNDKLVRRVGSEMLCREIEKAISAISAATALDTVEITDIFTKNPGATIADVSYRLHLRSLVDRSYTS